jgi:hypothetical protein
MQSGRTQGDILWVLGERKWTFMIRRVKMMEEPSMIIEMEKKAAEHLWPCTAFIDLSHPISTYDGHTCGGRWSHVCDHAQKDSDR